ncbi:MAG: hypothetical protein AAF431_19235 [Pseudomonadota bacterium]
MFPVMRLFLYLTVAIAFTGCSSLKLLDSNKQFVSLMQQSQEADRLRKADVIDAIAYEATIEGLQTDFANNGDQAVKAAESAKTDAAKASLLNVATRSYLNSDGLRDQQLLASADAGIEACSRLTGLNALPTTCGYFHIVIPQAVSNEWRREVEDIKRRQATLTPQEMLTVEEGKTLVAAAKGFISQLEALEDAQRRINFDISGENLKTHFSRQQEILFCNAQGALISLGLVVESGENWNRAEEERGARVLLQEQKSKLKAREGGLSPDACN